jgi:perosamine synthetase
LIPVNRPLIDYDDIAAVVQALSETYISGETPPVVDMELKLARITHTTNAVAVSTGTAAIDLAVEALGINPGDHCVVPNFTIVSTVSNLLRKGAKVEFIDADPITWSIDSAAAAAAIKPSTKLVLPVHIFGLSADMDPILKVTKELETFVLEDAAEALGVNYKDKPCGSIGDAAVFSFYANKIITGGEGGAITTNNKELTLKLKSLKNLAHTEERFMHETLGWNSRMSGLSAALINSQLNRLDKLLEIKKSMALQYLQGLKDHPWFTFMPDKVSYSTNAYWVFPIILNSESPYDAKQLQMLLRNNGVDSRRFFCPMHLQPFISKYDVIFKSENKISNNLWKRGLYLPSGLGNTTDEIFKVIELLWKFLNEFR